MSLLEQQIQTSFESEYHKALINVVFTNNALVNQMNEFFKGYDVTRQQYNVLKILKERFPKPSPIHLIRDRMLDKMSDASRIVERLRKKGLLVRTSSEFDKRSVQITISETGFDLLDSIESNLSKLEQGLRKLSFDEVSTLNNLLDKIRNSNSITRIAEPLSNEHVL